MRAPTHTGVKEIQPVVPADQNKIKQTGICLVAVVGAVRLLRDTIGGMSLQTVMDREQGPPQYASGNLQEAI